MSLLNKSNSGATLNISFISDCNDDDRLLEATAYNNTDDLTMAGFSGSGSGLGSSCLAQEDINPKITNEQVRHKVCKKYLFTKDGLNISFIKAKI
ncbi:MAG: hypothetical protein K2M03_00445 [Muribaculaceae bacterium]|nr:hypothetical protein [Muribaculaceae bacterium]